MDAAYLRELLAYDPETGVFHWRKRNGNIAGTRHSAGYVMMRIDTRPYFAHRLAWIYVHGSIPEGMEIDHKNRDKADNRIDNLRPATRAQNAANQNADPKRDLPKGVSFKPRNGRYYARINEGGRLRHLGYFDTIEEARAVYVLAADIYQGNFACI